MILHVVGFTSREIHENMQEEEQITLWLPLQASRNQGNPIIRHSQRLAEELAKSLWISNTTLSRTMVCPSELVSTIIPGNLDIPVLNNIHHVWPHYVEAENGSKQLYLLVHGWNKGKYAVLKLED